MGEVEKHFLSLFTLISFSFFWWNTGDAAQWEILGLLAFIVAVNSVCVCVIGVAEKKYPKVPGNFQ